MDPVQNPFSPGAGTPPPELAGRGELLEEARIMIGRTLNGRSTQGMLMTGLRGVGKTVILNELMRMAEEQGVLPLYVEATAESTLSELLASELKKLFFTLNRIAGWSVLPQGKKTFFMGCRFAMAIYICPMLRRFLEAVSHR